MTPPCQTLDRVADPRMASTLVVRRQPMAETPHRFENKVAIVTGGARGIGRAIARRLGADGATVIVVDVDANSGAATERDIREGGGQARFVACNVGSSADVEAMVNSVVDREGRID